MVDVALVAWLGIASMIFFVITLGLGIAMIYLKKNFLNQHKMLAVVTLIIALVHMTLALMFWLG